MLERRTLSELWYRLSIHFADVLLATHVFQNGLPEVALSVPVALLPMVAHRYQFSHAVILTIQLDYRGATRIPIPLNRIHRRPFNILTNHQGNFADIRLVFENLVSLLAEAGLACRFCGSLTALGGDVRWGDHDLGHGHAGHVFVVLFGDFVLGRVPGVASGCDTCHRSVE